jgi:hypothetical protein
VLAGPFQCGLKIPRWWSPKELKADQHGFGGSRL